MQEPQEYHQEDQTLSIILNHQFDLNIRLNQAFICCSYDDKVCVMAHSFGFLFYFASVFFSQISPFHMGTSSFLFGYFF